MRELVVWDLLRAIPTNINDTTLSYIVSSPVAVSASRLSRTRPLTATQGRGRGFTRMYRWFKSVDRSVCECVDEFGIVGVIGRVAIGPLKLKRTSSLGGEGTISNMSYIYNVVARFKGRIGRVRV